MTMTGGCQCGSVRFRCEIDRDTAHICHCRMCQKAFGSFFAPLVSVRAGSLVWTKTQPRRFASSNVASRGFCPQCGTPLTYEVPEGIAMAIGAFDDPASIPPLEQHGTEGRLGYVDQLADLPGHETTADEETPYLADVVTYQHPDAPGGDEQPETTHH